MNGTGWRPLIPPGKQVLHWDADLKGFGVLCSGKTAAKTYVVQRDINMQAVTDKLKALCGLDVSTLVRLRSVI
ncbi:MAG: hypothetical protein K2Q10_01125 [Rhodospirillales bacterium]|nr:hypothetical protein [Rhodospirillales bacterium]